MKKRIAVLAGILCSLMLNGCSFSSFSGTKSDTEQSLIPSDALIATADNKIKLGEKDLNIPEGYTIGTGTFTDSTSNNQFELVGVWKTEDKEATPSTISNDVSSLLGDISQNTDYKEAIDNDILFYVLSGEDKASPDRELSRGEVKSSLAAYNTYLTSLLSINYPMIDDITLNDSDGYPIVDELGNTSPRVSADGKWYYTAFTATSGKGITTTYNTLCYPKSYYGILLLGKDQNPDHSREYRIFVFSNDGNGKIMGRNEYDSLFKQIKNIYQLHGFYTMPQLSTMKDSLKNYYNGRSYLQFNDLMLDTHNYYILKENGTVSETGEVQMEVKP